jgi:putative ABC transport system permease protein
MFKNYFKTAVRNLWKHKTFSFINIIGLTIGLTSFILIALFIFDELTFDGLHKNADNIYRVVESKTSAEGVTAKRSGTGFQVSARAKTGFPEIADVARISVYWRADIRPGDNQANVFHEYFIAANPGFLNVFSFPLIYGDRSSALTEPKSVILTEESAKKFFGASNVVGKILFFDNDSVPYKVTGVLKNFPSNSSISYNLLVSESSILNNEGAKLIADHPGNYDPPSLLRYVRGEIMNMATDHITMFGSAGNQVRGFGFLHDGSVDSLARFISEPAFFLNDNQEVADLTSFVLCLS